MRASTWFILGVFMLASACSSTTTTSPGGGGAGNGGGAGSGGGGGGGSGGGGGGGGGSCANIAGTWSVSGTCGGDTCIITQQGCTTNFLCGSGSASYTGSLNGNDASWSGKSAQGANGSCTGVVQGSQITGQCTLDAGGTCTFDATKQ